MKDRILKFVEEQVNPTVGEIIAQYFDVIPDIIVLGKGFGAGLPIAATIISDKLKGFEPDAEELHTFANSSVAQVAASKQF